MTAIRYVATDEGWSESDTDWVAPGAEVIRVELPTGDVHFFATHDDDKLGIWEKVVEDGVLEVGAGPYSGPRRKYGNWLWVQTERWNPRARPIPRRPNP